MTCPRCAFTNPPAMAFCGRCGTRLAALCPSCGYANPDGFAFCGKCGTRVAEAPTPSLRGSPAFTSPQSYTPKHLAEKILISKTALEGERKQVTVLFADVKGSMELLADRDPEEARKLLDPVLERMMEAVHRYEGTVNQVMGDGIMALFGAPLAHEDHAIRACYAAHDMQATMRRYTEEVRHAHGIEVQIRVGLNSGEVVVRAIGSDLHMDYTAVGQTTHLAARMEQLAPPGTIRLTADTLRLAEGYIEVKPLGTVPVKGLATPIDVYEMVGAGPRRSRLHAAAARGLTRFVGRETELESLRQGLARAASGHGQIVAIVGEPGVGKSRLVWEITHSHRVHGWLVLQAGSVSYGKATSYLPVIDLLKGYFGIEDRDGPRVVQEKLTGKLLTLDRAQEGNLPALLSLLDVPTDDPQWPALDPPQRRQRTLDAVKRLLLRETQVQPLLVVVEDLHWIDSETQAVLDSLVESLPTARMLLLVNYRPEYTHRWGSKTYYTQLRLDPLPPESAEVLLDALLGSDPVLRPLKHLLIERTEGNPFFLEESVRTLWETKELVGDRGAWRLANALPALRVPPTVQAVLAARIDRLPPEDKRVLQAAAVIGQDVSYAILHAITELPEDDLRGYLDHLQAREFLYETRLFPDLGFTFKHALTQGVAYQSLVTERRQALHTAAATALERLHPEGSCDELLAHHYRSAGRWAEALRYLGRAAAAAERMYAVREALAHHTTALEVAEAVAPEARPALVRRLRLARGRVYARAGSVGEARVDLEVALAGARAVGDRREEMEALDELGFLLAGAADYREAMPHLQAALTLAEELQDQPAQATILSRLSILETNRLDCDQAMAHAQRAIEVANMLGDPRVRARAQDSLLLVASLLGDLPMVETVGHDLVQTLRAQGDLWYLQSALAEWATAPFGMGRWDEALTRLREGLEINRRIGAHGNEPHFFTMEAKVWRSRGEYGRALATGHEALALALRLGHPEWIAFSETELGRVLQELYAFDEAASHFERGLAAAERVGSHFHTLNLVSLCAWNAHLLGDAARAQALVQQARDRASRIRTPAGYAVLYSTPALVALARLDIADGNPEQGEYRLTPILTAAEASGWQEAIAWVELAIAAARAARGDRTDAARAARRAVAVAEETGLPAVAWRGHAVLRALATTAGRTDEADHHRTATRAVIDRLGSTVHDDALRTGFLREAGRDVRCAADLRT
jgi:class 3 adenylate cyclase/tetratricopeptide (TPR) repeat protein